MKEQMKERKIKKLKEKGITLIALVVTIIILLILAGVTLNIALSYNGLFKKARDVAEKYKEAQREEERKITEIEKQFRPVVTTMTEFAESNIEAKDSLGNLITIPKGFKIVNGDTVQDGIVIEDKDENQFVWIPVSNIDGDNNAKTEPNSEDLITINGDEKVEITLGRYIFKRELNNETQTYGDGTPTLVQKGSECTKNGEKYMISGKWEENTRIGQIEGYAKAKDLKGFVESVKKNHGYYIARYEAGKSELKEEIPVSTKGKTWDSLTQGAASLASQKMYEGDGSFESDLVNSFAWDTAIVFIQAMEHSDYSIESSVNKHKMETGETNDEKCHIYDMSGNVMEWTTEFSSAEYLGKPAPCSCRGGSIMDEATVSSGCARDRNYTNEDETNWLIGFRPLLYLT